MNADPTDDLAREFGWFLWEHVGRTVAVVLERAGVERHYEGPVVVHWDGSFHIGEQFFANADDAGRPVRWTAR